MTPQGQFVPAVLANAANDQSTNRSGLGRPLWPREAPKYRRGATAPTAFAEAWRGVRRARDRPPVGRRFMRRLITGLGGVGTIVPSPHGRIAAMAGCFRALARSAGRVDPCSPSKASAIGLGTACP
jgi:hypothetical protein